MDDPLAIYLHDHLAGSAMAIELLRAMHSRETPLLPEDFVAGLLADLQVDREILEQLIEKAGSRPSTVKDAGGWLSGMAARLALHDSGTDPFHTLQALEFLAVGILGKAKLWKALNQASTLNPRLAGFDFAALAERAGAQHAGVEQRRLELAGAVFGSSGSLNAAA